MIGKAIEEGVIKSLNDPVTDYLPSLSHVDTKYSEVQISHLLDMKSGISFVDHDLPWGDKPKAYYYPDLRKRIKELPVNFTPGTRFEYNSYNPILLGMILEKSAQIIPAEYFEEKIWNKLGMEYTGSWSMDSEESGMTKMESGLNLRAIDLAKFGCLVLREGNWEGEQVISSSWLKSSFDIKDEDKVKKFGENIYYKNFWWIYANDSLKVEIISAWGHLGQYLFIFPEQEIIIVRMGKEKGDVDSWGNIFKEIVNSIQ